MPVSRSYEVFYGDIHIHSGLSRCFRHGPFRKRFSFKGDDRELNIATIDECYRYAREESEFDFAALADHDFHMSDSDWELAKRKAAEFHEPGRFVTFSAFEWTSSAYGHYNVYYLTEDQPLFRCVPFGTQASRERGMTPAQLWRHLEENRAQAITIPHHVAVTHFPLEWDFYSPNLEPVVEITSVWGNFEFNGNPGQGKLSDSLPGYFVQDALSRGYKLGIVGGSDNHWGTPGSASPRPLTQKRRKVLGTLYPEKNPLGMGIEEIGRNTLGDGFTAVLAEELTRKSIMDALKRRRCYATTCAKIVLDFHVDGHPMGEEYTISDPKAYPEILAHVEGTQDIERIDLVKNGTTLYSQRGRSQKESLSYMDDQVTSANNYYYIRVVQADRRMAWSSPVWVTWKCLPDLKICKADLQIGGNIVQARIHNIGNSVAENFAVSFYERVPFARISDEAPIALKTSGEEGNVPPFKGTLLWKQHLRANTIKVSLRMRGGAERHNFSGELQINSFKKYFVQPYLFTLKKFGGDLFTDDGNGRIRWNLNTGSTLKGLDMVVKPDRYRDSHVIVNPLMDGKPCTECTWVGLSNVNRIPFKIELNRYDEDLKLRDLNIAELLEGKTMTLEFGVESMPDELYVIADPQNSVTESDEENNEALL
ncbi:MAG: CehA/McbA family metallohydrolase, partial [Candidatus Thorarchaeota archaeon]